MKRLAILLALAGCAETVDPDVLADYPIDDYRSWAKQVDVQGKAPGHADSYRVIYANDLAADPDQSFILGYQEGSIFVKEIRDNNDGAPGDLRYLAIMRRIGAVEAALEDEGGWLFSSADTLEDPEQSFGFCWGRCHAVAPYNGAFYDYRK